MTLKYHCKNHIDRPAFVEKNGQLLCMECEFGEQEFISRFGQTPKKFYDNLLNMYKFTKPTDKELLAAKG